MVRSGDAATPAIEARAEELERLRVQTRHQIKRAHQLAAEAHQSAERAHELSDDTQERRKNNERHAEDARRRTGRVRHRLSGTPISAGGERR